MSNNEDNAIKMLDEDGSLLEFEHLLTFEVENEFFIAFTPFEDTEEFKVGEVLIMQIEEDDQKNDLYVPIDSQERLDELWEIFQQLYDAVYETEE